MVRIAHRTRVANASQKTADLDIDVLLLSNACGGLNRQFAAGDAVLVRNHLNLTAQNPLIGANDERVGVRWPHMKDPYSSGEGVNVSVFNSVDALT